MSNFYKDILDGLYDGIYFVDTKRKITFWNKAAERLTGYSSEELEGRFCFDNILDHVDINNNHLCHDGCPLHATIQDGVQREAAVFLRHKNGDRKPVVVKTMPLYEDDKIIGAIEIFNDNYQLFNTLKELNTFKDLAFRDNLTGLSNRHFIDEFLSTSSSFGKVRASVLFIDIDDFKRLNDTYGHPYGDEVLIEVGKTLKANVKKSDEVFRYGGEEFMVLIFEDNFENVVDVAERIREMIESLELRFKGKRTPITISMGATMVQENEALSIAIERADQLMYKSKVSGKNKVTT